MIFDIEEKLAISDCVRNLAEALSTAVDNRLLSIEHAGAIFKHYIAQMGIDAPRIKSDSKSKPNYVSQEEKS